MKAFRRFVEVSIIANLAITLAVVTTASGNTQNSETKAKEIFSRSFANGTKDFKVSKLDISYASQLSYSQDGSIIWTKSCSVDGSATLQGEYPALKFKMPPMDCGKDYSG